MEEEEEEEDDDDDGDETDGETEANVKCSGRGVGETANVDERGDCVEEDEQLPWLLFLLSLSQSVRVSSASFSLVLIESDTLHIA